MNVIKGLSGRPLATAVLVAIRLSVSYVLHGQHKVAIGCQKASNGAFMV